MFSLSRGISACRRDLNSVLIQSAMRSRFFYHFAGLLVLLSWESIAFSSPLTDLLDRVISLNPPPKASRITKESWRSWVDHMIAHLHSSPEAEAGSSAHASSTSAPTPSRELKDTLIHQLTQIKAPADETWGRVSEHEILSFLEGRYPEIFLDLKHAASIPHAAGGGSVASVESHLSALTRAGKHLHLILGRTNSVGVDPKSNSLLPEIEDTLWVVGDLLVSDEAVGHSPIGLKLDFNRPESLLKLEANLFDEIYLDWSTSKFILNHREFLTGIQRILTPGGALFLPVGEGANPLFNVPGQDDSGLHLESPHALFSFFPTSEKYPLGIAVNFGLNQGISRVEYQKQLKLMKKQLLQRVCLQAQELGYSSVSSHEQTEYPIRSDHFLEESDGTFEIDFVRLQK